MTDRGWQATDELTDFTVWDVAEVTLERRYMGKAEPEVLVLKCRKIVCTPLELFPDKASVKEPKTLIIDGIDAMVLRSLPFEPPHVSFSGLLIQSPSLNYGSVSIREVKS